MNRSKWNFLFLFLGWSFVLFLVLVSAGLVSHDVCQSSGCMQWLLSRRWYPYLQSASLSILLMTVAIVASSLIGAIDNVNGVIIIAARLLSKIGAAFNESFPAQRNSVLWGFLLLLSASFFVTSLLIPNCIAISQAQVTFEITNNGRMVGSVYPGEMLPVGAERHLDIETKFAASLPSLYLSQITCAWTYMGDGGTVSAAQCRLHYRTGTDDIPDTITVKLSQPFCPSLGYYTFLLGKLEPTGDTP
jgi:hypothetical protein